ncbi:MAG TPA: zinc-binding dehydrogenase [Streptosporangiaceae bacterium]|nr:zinc-binding dehydrogenase [Streptosporangiaceae bacterium]
MVESLGPGVTGLDPGDRVMAMTHFPGGAGGYAELAVVDAGQAARIGPGTSFADAAATPLAAGTAAVILARLALRPGSRLLVLAASGGVGLFLLQLAAHQGIRVAAIEAPSLDLDLLIDANITFHGILVRDDGERTRQLAALLAAGALRPVISHQLPLARAAEAHRIQEGRHAGGKIVLSVAG